MLLLANWRRTCLILFNQEKPYHIYETLFSFQRTTLPKRQLRYLIIWPTWCQSKVQISSTLISATSPQRRSLYYQANRTTSTFFETFSKMRTLIFTVISIVWVWALTTQQTVRVIRLKMGLCLFFTPQLISVPPIKKPRTTIQVTNHGAELHDRLQIMPTHLQKIYGRKVGKRSTSRIEGASVKSITSRSIPIPKPPVGGIP